MTSAAELLRDSGHVRILAGSQGHLVESRRFLLYADTDIHALYLARDSGKRADVLAVKPLYRVDERLRYIYDCYPAARVVAYPAQRERFQLQSALALHVEHRVVYRNDVRAQLHQFSRVNVGLRGRVAVFEAAAVRSDSCVETVRDGACYLYFFHGTQQLEHQFSRRRVLGSKQQPLGVLGVADVVVDTKLSLLADLAHAIKQLGVSDIDCNDGFRLEILLL